MTTVIVEPPLVVEREPSRRFSVLPLVLDSVHHGAPLAEAHAGRSVIDPEELHGGIT